MNEEDKAEMVALFEKLLEEAKAGNIQGAAVAIVRSSDKTISVDSRWWRQHRHAFDLLGALRIMETSYIDYMTKAKEP